MAHAHSDNNDALIRRAVREALEAIPLARPGVAPRDPDARLTRKETAAALTAAGLPVAEKTLATKATRGGGPAYSLFSGRALYRWGDALAWAEARVSTPRRNTSEAAA